MILFFVVLYTALILVALINAPWVPAFFGIYGGARNSFYGRLIIALLILFPFVVGLTIYAASIGHWVWCLAPIAYLLGLWVLRPNRYRRVSKGRQHASLQNNQQALNAQLEWKSEGWDLKHGETVELALDIFAPENDVLMHLRKSSFKVPAQETLDPDGVITVFYCFEHNGPNSLRGALRACIELVWKAGGEVRSIEIEP